MNESINNRIENIDTQINELNEAMKTITEAMLKLRSTRADLVAAQDYFTYKKWDVKENSYYVRFIDDPCGILMEGLQIVEDEQDKSRLKTNSLMYRCYDDEYSALVQVRYVSYHELERLMTGAHVYTLDAEDYALWVMTVMSLLSKSSVDNLHKTFAKTYKEIK